MSATIDTSCCSRNNHWNCLLSARVLSCGYFVEQRPMFSRPPSNRSHLEPRRVFHSTLRYICWFLFRFSFVAIAIAAMRRIDEDDDCTNRAVGKLVGVRWGRSIYWEFWYGLLGAAPVRLMTESRLRPAHYSPTILKSPFLDRQIEIKAYYTARGIDFTWFLVPRRIGHPWLTVKRPPYLHVFRITQENISLKLR